MQVACCAAICASLSVCCLLQEEFDAIMLPKHNKGTNNMGRHLLQHEPLSEAASVPSTVSWVGTAGGGMVTDQAVCGSCWAFATAAALQGAVWMKTGGTPLHALSLTHHGAVLRQGAIGVAPYARLCYLS